MNANIDAAATTPPNGKRRRILLLIAVIFIVIGALWAAYWVLVLDKREKTDDAYINGNRVVISAQVSGTVVAVLADDTQLVNAGQVLVKLDPTDAQTALSRAASALGSAVRQVRQQKATAGQYDSEIETRKLELSRAQIDLAKREPLVADQAIAGEEVRHAEESVHLARAALSQAEGQSLSAHALVDGTAVESNPTVLQAKDAYRDAWIAAQRNAVVAPVSGYVAERRGAIAQPAHRPEDRGAQRSVWRHVYFSRPRRGNVGGNGRGVFAAATAKCVGQLDQGGAARTGANSH